MQLGTLICIFIISTPFLVTSQRHGQRHSRDSQFQNNLHALPYFKDWAGSPLTTALDDVFTYSLYSVRALRGVLREFSFLVLGFLCLPDKVLTPFWRAFYFAVSPLFKSMYQNYRPLTEHSAALLMLPPPSCDSDLDSCSSPARSDWHRRIPDLVYRTAVYVPRPVYSILFVAAFAIYVKRTNSALPLQINRLVRIFQSRQRLCFIFVIASGLYALRPLIIELVNCAGTLFATFQSFLLLATYIVLHLAVPFLLLSLAHLLYTQIIAF